MIILKSRTADRLSLQGVKDPRWMVGMTAMPYGVGLGVASHPAGARPSTCPHDLVWFVVPRIVIGTSLSSLVAFSVN
jgi:hypothetical protein